MSETDLMRQILVAVSAIPGAVFWRVNVGVFKSISGRETVRCGIPGQADIAGCYLGRHVEIEVKTDKGRLSPVQKRWKMAVERAGGIWVLARNPADALAVLAALDAQSGRLPVPIHKPAAVNSEAGNGEALS
jgi:hypothetical protein